MLVRTFPQGAWDKIEEHTTRSLRESRGMMGGPASSSRGGIASGGAVSTPTIMASSAGPRTPFGDTGVRTGGFR